MKLSETEENKNYIIESFDGNEHFEGRISSMGIRKGVDITILKNKKKHPLLIFCRDTMIALERSLRQRLREVDLLWNSHHITNQM